jgi:hypothetical protein
MSEILNDPQTIVINQLNLNPSFNYTGQIPLAACPAPLLTSFVNNNTVILRGVMIIPNEGTLAPNADYTIENNLLTITFNYTSSQGSGNYNVVYVEFELPETPGEISQIDAFLSLSTSENNTVLGDPITSRGTQIVVSQR